MSNQSLNIMSHPVEIVGSPVAIPISNWTHMQQVKPTSGLAVPAYWQAWGHGRPQWFSPFVPDHLSLVQLQWCERAANDCAEGCCPWAKQHHWSGCWDGHKSFSDILARTEGSPSSNGSKISSASVELCAISCESIGRHAWNLLVVAREGLLSLSVDDSAWVVLVKTASSTDLQSVMYHWLSPLPCTFII